jgi:hypothetical protein
VTEPVYYAPTDPEAIKEHIIAHQQAVRIILAQLTMLSERLRHMIGPVAWLEFMGKNNADIMEEMTRHESSLKEFRNGSER